MKNLDLHVSFALFVYYLAQVVQLVRSRHFAGCHHAHALPGDSVSSPDVRAEYVYIQVAGPCIYNLYYIMIDIIRSLL